MAAPTPRRFPGGVPGAGGGRPLPVPGATPSVRFGHRDVLGDDPVTMTSRHDRLTTPPVTPLPNYGRVLRWPSSRGVRRTTPPVTARLNKGLHRRWTFSTLSALPARPPTL